MSKQTIDGVSRETIRRIADHCKFWIDHPYLEAIADVEVELRALLDAPAKSAEGLEADNVKLAADRATLSAELETLRKSYRSVLAQLETAQYQGEPVATNREQFEAWVLGLEHPTYGWLDRHWLTRGDNPETYADPYVQGLWVASQSLYAEQPAPTAARNPPTITAYSHGDYDSADLVAALQEELDRPRGFID